MKGGSPSHTSHAAALDALIRHHGNGSAAAHSLADCFATLTGKRGFGLDQAAQVLRRNCVERLRIVPLGSREYLSVIDRARERGVRGGAIYDALLLACARKARAQRILTLNVRHFIAIAPDLEGRIAAPS